MKINVFWFRRDLRLMDNVGLFKAVSSNLPVLPVFIFDKHILQDLPKDDARVSFIYDQLVEMNDYLSEEGKSLKVFVDEPLQAWKQLLHDFEIHQVFLNRDYEPYALKRDDEVEDLLSKQGVELIRCKDQVIFEGNEVLKDNGDAYSVYTPYKNKWLEKFKNIEFSFHQTPPYSKFADFNFDFPSLETVGFKRSEIQVKDFDLDNMENYHEFRDIPAKDTTSYLSPHLRFGTVSVRKVVDKANSINEVLLSELIWREFFMQILYHYPRVINNNYYRKYDGIHWRNDENEFERWCSGTTGYPMVDAGMRQLNETGYMHNRVRMVTASFLCKHLLIDWRWGEAYFAKHLLDYELSSNNGNWQWAAGTGCDAAPYFRIFNPHTQLDKFDKEREYVKKWIKEYDTNEYPEPMVEHKFAKERALEQYKKGIE